MAKHKAGLHKKISSIFDGVPVPKDGDSQPEVAKSVPAYVPPAPKATPAPTPAQPPRAIPAPPAKTGGVATLPTPPKPVRPLPQQPPRTEPAVAAIKHYKLETEEPASDGFFSKIQAQIKQKVLTGHDGVDPKRQIAMAVMIPILAIILVVALTNAFKSPAGGTVAPTPDVQRNVSRAAIGLAAWKRPGPFPEDFRDPMKKIFSYSPLTGETGLDEINLSGITVSEDRKYISIAGKILREGDEVRVKKGDSVKVYLIASIAPSEVEYTCEGDRYTQKVGKELQPKKPMPSN